MGKYDSEIFEGNTISYFLITEQYQHQSVSTMDLPMFNLWDEHFNEKYNSLYTNTL